MTIAPSGIAEAIPQAQPGQHWETQRRSDTVRQFETSRTQGGKTDSGIQSGIDLGVHDLEAIETDSCLRMKRIDADPCSGTERGREVVEENRNPVPDMIEGQNRIGRADIQSIVVTQSQQPE